MPSFASIGSISTGTLLPEDLAEAFRFKLARLAEQDTDDEDRRRRTENALAELGSSLTLDCAARAAAVETFVNETAYELLDAYCAPFTYFGSHAGDGADIGIWPDINSLEEAARYEDGVIKVNAGDEWPEMARDFDYVMEVNDHGNVTLFCTKSNKALWSCV